MTTTDKSVEVSSKTKRRLSPNARHHLLAVCVALLGAGVLVPWLIPAVSVWWGVGAVAIASHVGLILVAGGAVFRWVGKRFD
ncbi:MAG: hypothetical protein GXP35_17485 [Actinobacteria bacterium]|nr:hypothetical protein [Actinomycetota bacterium]